MAVLGLRSGSPNPQSMAIYPALDIPAEAGMVGVGDQGSGRPGVEGYVTVVTAGPDELFPGARHWSSGLPHQSI